MQCAAPLLVLSEAVLVIVIENWGRLKKSVLRPSSSATSSLSPSPARPELPACGGLFLPCQAASDLVD